MSPLTHHEILGLVEPFTRGGRRVDLKASDRQRRRLVFMPVAHAASGPASDGSAGTPALTETLVLENAEAGTFRLIRTLALADGLEARLETDGPQAAELLARIDAIEPKRQVSTGPGFVIAQRHRVEPTPGRARDATALSRLVLTEAHAQVAGLTLALTVSRVRGIPGEMELVAPGGDVATLPEDLLAVLGVSWTRLSRVKAGWHASLRLRAREPERSSDAELKLEQTVAHLARTLAEPPRQFQERFGAARWRVTLRRSIPLAGTLALIGAAIAVPWLGLAEESVLRMLALNSPPLLLLMFFSMRELPRIEIPPWPRRLTAQAWRQPAQDASGAQPLRTGAQESRRA